MGLRISRGRLIGLWGVGERVTAVWFGPRLVHRSCLGKRDCNPTELLTR